MMRRRAVALAVSCAGAVSGCGRVGFDVADVRRDAGSIDAPTDAPIDGAPSPVVYVGPFVQRSTGAGPTDSFLAQARAAGDAVLIQVTCSGTAIPTGASVTAAGWSFTQLGPITASSQSSERSATFAAIAPDAVRTTVSLSWTGSNCGGGKNHVGDEFAMTDPAGGTLTFDAANATEGQGNCVGTVRTGHAGDAVWAACDSESSVTAVGAAFTKAADDGVGDWSEYAITDHPAGTLVPVEFTNDNVGYVLSMVTLKPR